MQNRDGFGVVNYKDELLGLDAIGAYVPEHPANVALFRTAVDAERLADFINRGEVGRRARAVRVRLEVSEL